MGLLDVKAYRADSTIYQQLVSTTVISCIISDTLFTTNNTCIISDTLSTTSYNMYTHIHKFITFLTKILTLLQLHLQLQKSSLNLDRITSFTASYSVEYHPQHYPHY